MENLPVVLTDDDGIRPAGSPNKCFYCNQETGQPHKEECVILNKKIKVKYTFELEIEVPWHWTEKDVKFHREMGTWCADNAIEEMEKYTKKDEKCLCPNFQCDVLEIISKEPYRKNKKGKIVP